MTARSQIAEMFGAERPKALSPRIERTADKLRREKREAEAIKADEMEPSLETDG